MGTSALICACVGSLIAGLLALATLPAEQMAKLAPSSTRASSSRQPLMLAIRIARLSFGLSAAALTVAVLRLAIAFGRNELHFASVAANVRNDTGLATRISGLWAGSEGSLLLFTATVTLILATQVRHLRAAPLAMAALTSGALATTVVLAASPFEVLSLPPISGRGVTPILEHWAMIVHPPLLYAGLATSLAPALVGDSGRARRLAVLAFLLLTIALTLGAAWAYVELGWGGWWAWDPVENVALIPWLLLVATLHMPTGSPTGFDQRGVVYTAIWPLVFAGTALTRTSLRTSVHAFANAEGLRWWLWSLTAAIAVVAIMAMMITTTRTMRAGAIDAHPDSNSDRHRGRLLAVGTLTIATVIVALGTFRPFVPGEGTEGWFYSRMLFPLVVGGAIALGVAPLLWPSDPSRPRRTFVLTASIAVGAIVAVVAAVVFDLSRWYQWTLALALGIGIVTLMADRTATSARRLGHLGMALVLVAAVAGTTSVRRTVLLEPGQSVMIASRTITNEAVEVIDEVPPRIVATVQVADGNRRHLIQPSIGVYADRRIRLAEVATVSRLSADVQVILRSADDEGAMTLTVQVRPLNQLVWVGAACLSLSGAALVLRRRRALTS